MINYLSFTLFTVIIWFFHHFKDKGYQNYYLLNWADKLTCTWLSTVLTLRTFFCPINFICVQITRKQFGESKLFTWRKFPWEVCPFTFFRLVSVHCESLSLQLSLSLSFLLWVCECICMYKERGRLLIVKKLDLTVKLEEPRFFSGIRFQFVSPFLSSLSKWCKKQQLRRNWIKNEKQEQHVLTRSKPDFETIPCYLKSFS